MVTPVSTIARARSAVARPGGTMVSCDPMSAAHKHSAHPPLCATGSKGMRVSTWAMP